MIFIWLMPYNSVQQKHMSSSNKMVNVCSDIYFPKGNGIHVGVIVYLLMNEHGLNCFFPDTVNLKITHSLHFIAKFIYSTLYCILFAFFNLKCHSQYRVSISQNKKYISKSTKRKLLYMPYSIFKVNLSTCSQQSDAPASVNSRTKTAPSYIQ